MRSRLLSETCTHHLDQRNSRYPARLEEMWASRCCPSVICRSHMCKTRYSFFHGCSLLMRLSAAASKRYISSCGETSTMSFVKENVLRAVLLDMMHGQSPRRILEGLLVRSRKGCVEVVSKGTFSACTMNWQSGTNKTTLDFQLV